MASATASTSGWSWHGGLGHHRGAVPRLVVVPRPGRGAPPITSCTGSASSRRPAARRPSWPGNSQSFSSRPRPAQQSLSCRAIGSPLHEVAALLADAGFNMQVLEPTSSAGLDLKPQHHHLLSSTTPTGQSLPPLATQLAACWRLADLLSGCAMTNRLCCGARYLHTSTWTPMPPWPPRPARPPAVPAASHRGSRAWCLGRAPRPSRSTAFGSSVCAHRR